ncbi:MAG: MFS transporter [Burkholderiaceae bacterium]|jgi:AAHS family 4-hydroxybenzoate transporter-like MFS transporter|nr:MFS transporter [Burkholderiaceae bacterium]
MTTSTRSTDAFAQDGSARAGWGPIGILVLCLLVIVLDGYDTTAIGFVIPTLAREWGQHPSAFTPTLVATSAGAVLGYMLSGRMAAWWGRHAAIMTGVSVFAAGSLATAAATSIGSITVLRLLTGIGLGAVLPAAVSLAVAQFDAKRGEMVAVAVIAGLSLGAVTGGLSGGWLIGNFGWRSVFVLGGLLPMLLVPALWLGLPADREALPGASHSQGKARELLVRGLRLRTSLIWAFAFLIFVSTYALQLWIPTLLLSYGFSPQQAPQGLAAMGVGGLLGAILLTAFSGVFRVFRVLPFLVAVAILAIVLAARLPLSGSTALLAVGGMGLGLIAGCIGQAAMAVSLYEPALRTAGVGWAAAMGRIGSIVGPAAGGLLLASGQSARDTILWACAPALLAVVVVVLLGLVARRPA